MADNDEQRPQSLTDIFNKAKKGWNKAKEFLNENFAIQEYQPEYEPAPAPVKKPVVRRPNGPSGSLNIRP